MSATPPSTTAATMKPPTERRRPSDGVSPSGSDAERERTPSECSSDRRVEVHRAQRRRGRRGQRRRDLDRGRRRRDLGTSTGGIGCVRVKRLVDLRRRAAAALVRSARYRDRTRARSAGGGSVVCTDAICARCAAAGSGGGTDTRAGGGMATGGVDRLGARSVQRLLHRSAAAIGDACAPAGAAGSPVACSVAAAAERAAAPGPRAEAADATPACRRRRTSRSRSPVVATTGGRRLAPPLIALVEERRELGDLADRLLLQPAAREQIVALDEVRLDRALQLAQGREDERAPVAGLDVPEVLAEITVAPANLELVPAVGALDRRAATADERVVELVLGVAALTSDVHSVRAGPSANQGNTQGFPWHLSRGHPRMALDATTRRPQRA